MHRLLITKCAGVTAVNREVLEDIHAAAGVIERRVAIVPIGYDEELARKASLVEHQRDRGHLRISYFGSLYEGRVVQGLAEAMDRVLNAATNHRITMNFAGCDVPPELATLTVRHPRFNAVSHGIVPRDELTRFIGTTDVFLLITSKNYRAEHTSKLFDYMAMKRPILAIAPLEGAAARVIRQCNLGVVAEHDNGPALDACIHTFLSGTSDAMVSSGLVEAYEGGHCGENTASFLRDVFSSTVGSQTLRATNVDREGAGGRQGK
jgi:hypothetical protein